MTEIEDFKPETAAHPPTFHGIDFADESEIITDDAETTARGFLTNYPDAKVLITKLAVAGNLANEYANPCKRDKYCGSYEFSPGEELENLYTYVQENFEGGKYRFQIRAGQRNGRSWQKTLSDLPGTKKRGEAARTGEIDDERDEAREQNVIVMQHPEPPKTESPMKIARQAINENLSFMKDIKEIFGDVIGAQQQPPAQTTPTREQVLFELAKSAEDKEVKRRCLDAIIGDESEKTKSKTFADVLTDLIANPEILERPAQILAPVVMPYLAPVIGAIFARGQQPPPNAPGMMPLMNPPAHFPPPPTSETPMMPAEQTASATKDDSEQKSMSPNVVSIRKPRKARPEEEQEQSADV